MRATHTMAVGSFKRAQILPPAAQYCGALELIEMKWTGLVGQTPADTEETSGEVPVYFYEGTGGSRFVQVPAFDDDKYARGVVGLVAGIRHLPRVLACSPREGSWHRASAWCDLTRPAASRTWSWPPNRASSWWAGAFRQPHRARSGRGPPRGRARTRAILRPVRRAARHRRGGPRPDSGAGGHHQPRDHRPHPAPR